MTVLVPLFVVGFLFGLAIVLKGLNRNTTRAEIAVGLAYLISLLSFLLGMFGHSNEYFTAIDPVDLECYTPFAGRHALTLLFYFGAFNISAFLVWTKLEMLPPLAIVLCAVFMVIGVVLGVVLLVHLSDHDLSTVDIYNDGSQKMLFWSAPAFAIVIGVRLLFVIVTARIDASLGRVYSNKYLEALHVFLVERSRNLFWIILFLLPVYLVVTLILLLFGQDTDSIAKVFTDTTTWKLSQQAHPPVLTHKGHYLCTVAAAGNPEIVKPLRIGKRHGKPIIVNRQLLVANAFEELVQDSLPRLHRFIRRNYDKYGFDLSKRINTVFLSNLTYVLMKPLEWFFVVCLYLFCREPEEKIGRQYKC